MVRFGDKEGEKKKAVNKALSSCGSVRAARTAVFLLCFSGISSLGTFGDVVLPFTISKLSLVPPLQ